MFGKDFLQEETSEGSPEETMLVDQDTFDVLQMLGVFPSPLIEECAGVEMSVPKNTTMPANPKQVYGDKKVPLHLVPPASIAFEAMALADGARKYGAYNWRENNVEEMTYIGAAMRHIGQYLDGDEYDAVSGMPHLAHAKACLGILIDAKENGNNIDNRPKLGPMSNTLHEYETK